MYLCGNRYRVIGRLGEGGFGDVYLAEDRILKKTWAIKDIGESDRISYSLVRSEVSVLAKVSHPGIVRITDVFRSDGHIYIVMDHIKGMNLKELMNPDRKLSEKMLFKWSAELCDAISYLHHMNPPVILCDIKPQNIMVKPDGHIVLIDFGAAIPYASDDKDELSFISRGYASPEQLKGDRADIKSDIYSLGKVLDLLSGKSKPFGFSAVIKRCTMKNPKLRYKSAKAVRRDIVIVRNLTRIAAALIIFLIGGCMLLFKAREGALDINEQSRIRQAYEQGLMCFYELDDYEAAGRYLAEVSENEYPEAKYYIELSSLISGGDDSGKLADILKSFESFNEDTISKEDPVRYIKNVFCIAKVYISYDTGGDRFDKAFAIVSRILGKCEKSGYREDALKLIINILILQGRSDESIRTRCYHEAIGYIEELISLPESEDDASVIARYMDEASLYTELGENEKAIEVYENTESLFPYDPGIRYFAHLSLLIQSGADASEIRSLWDAIEKVEGIETDSNYEKMKERMEGYGG
ncbi:MAG: protein kinase [Lachnospiraceae bacterium]|nr:protein kinase [Lachnospiraceae bacterium]